MSKENSNTGIGQRISRIISALDYSSSDFIYDNIEESTNKLRELEARIARLENPESDLREVHHQQTA